MPNPFATVSRPFLKLALPLTVFLFIALLELRASEPLSLHPQNPHYFFFRGKPTVLITSGEHYGAVLNPDFDYVAYLDTLAADKLNLTRTFSGVYAEPPGAFNISGNTLSPASGRLLSPWARSDQPGYSNGGNKFDLNKWDAYYFYRLRDFVAQAAKRGVVVELNLFCPMYEDSQWRLSPMNAINNVNSIGDLARTNVYTLDKNGGLLAAQEAVTHKIVSELKDFDNVYYEICNEPYFGGVTLEWQRHIADVITDAEKSFKHRHLISQNIANGSAKINDPHPSVGIFNFHYASPPKTVALNYALNKVIGDNETGFKGTNVTHYRMEGWEFILAGGGLYNNLDYSFTAGHERGDFVYPAKQPGTGNPEFRRELRVLHDFINRFDFVKMKPDNGIIKAGIPEKGHAYALAETGRQYALYLFGDGASNLSLDVPAGKYRVEWLNPITGKYGQAETLKHSGGELKLAVPAYESEFALRLVK